jgi:ParB/RepB/Spo0J family partition protein
LEIIMTDKLTQAHAAASEVIAKAIAGAKPAASSNPAGVLKRGNSYSIDPTKIVRREGFNPRFDFGEIDELAQSIKANGLLNAIRVKRLVKPDEAGNLFELIDGDRRLTAIEKLIKKGHDFPEGIPAIIVDKAQDDVTSLIQMFEANSGKTFLPLEEAAAYKRMQDAGMTIAAICKAVGRKQVHVTEILNILKADDSLKDAAADGSIGKTMVKQIAKVAKGDKAKQKELVAQAKAAGTDKTKRRALLKEVDKTRVATAAKKGKVLKIRALSDHELSEIGAAMAQELIKALGAADLAADADLRTWVGKDKELVAAYTFGALEALKVAAGGINNLAL